MSIRNNIRKTGGTAAIAVLTSALVAACGGGGYDGGGTPPAKVAPTITGLADQTLPQDTSTPVLSFTVADSDSGVGNLTVTAVSSDTNLIPAAGLVLGGSGASRTLQITPAAEAFGMTMITIRAVDPDGLSVQQVLRVAVNGVFVSFRDTVIDVFGRAENGDEKSLRGFTFTQDADDDPNAFDAQLQ